MPLFFFLQTERSANADAAGAASASDLDACLEGGAMKRQVRSGGLSSYLLGLAQCVASSAGRPR